MANADRAMEALAINAFKETIKNAEPSEGKIVFNGPRKVIVSSTWNQRNVERKCVMSSKFVQLVELDCQEVTNLHASDNSAETMTSYSPCFKYRAVFRDVPPSGKRTTSSTHLELWQNNKMIKNVDLTTLDVHGDVYTDEEFGCLEWSPCTKKILYTAEKKKKKAEPFLPLPQKPSEDVSYGSEYVMVEDWGEMMVGKSSPVLAVWDTVKNKVSVVSPESSELSIGRGIWAPDGSIVCVGWNTQPRRMGKVYFLNRPSWLLHITDGNATNLTKDGLTIMSPRFSKDGSKLIWLERKLGGVHHACMRLMKMDWKTKEVSVVVDVIDEFVMTANDEKFYGLFTYTYGNCWLDDNKTIIINSFQRASIRMYAVDTDSKKIWDISGCSSDSEEFSINLLEVQGDLILASKSSLLCTPSLLIGRFNKTNVEWITLMDSTPTVADYLVDVIRLESYVNTELAKDFSAIYFGPKAGTKVPLILYPHGGPHATSNNAYDMLATFFGKLGFAVLFVNFRGSTGAGEAAVKSLLGNLGTPDVMDCHQSAAHVLKKYSDILSPDKCLLFGGSYGGFLALHLVGQFPSFFKSAVAFNPLVDIPGFSPSDIPNLVIEESGLTYTHTPLLKTDEFAALRGMSPISHVDAVKVPVLLLIGKVDLRVPPSQGINYYYALKARGIKTKVLMYDDNHILPKTPHVVDFFINTILWFLDTIEHELPPSTESG